MFFLRKTWKNTGLLILVTETYWIIKDTGLLEKCWSQLVYLKGLSWATTFPSLHQ